MDVNPDISLRATFQGETYYFCSPVCKALFEREPEKYTLPAGKPGAPETDQKRPL